MKPRLFGETVSPPPMLSRIASTTVKMSYLANRKAILRGHPLERAFIGASDIYCFAIGCRNVGCRETENRCARQPAITAERQLRGL